MHLKIVPTIHSRIPSCNTALLLQFSILQMLRTSIPCIYPSQHFYLSPWYIPVTAYCCLSICLSARDKEGSVTSEQCCWSQPYGTWKPLMTLSTSLSTSTPSTDTCPTISREYWGSKLLHVLIKITCKVQSCARNSILWICVSIKLSASQLVKFHLVHAIPGMKWLSGLLPNSFRCSIFFGLLTVYC